MSFAGKTIETVDFRYILLDNYKKLSLDEKELATIMVIDHLLRQGNDLVTADLLRLKMNLKTNEIDSILVSLMKRGFLEFDSSKGNMRTSLEPLRKKLYELLEQDIAKERSNLVSAQRSETLNTLYSLFEKRLNRTLAPIETDQLSTWLDDGYSQTQIKDALEDCLAAKKKSFKSIDKILRSNRAREDIKSEGYTGVSEEWNKSIQETIEIAKTKWLDDE